MNSSSVHHVPAVSVIIPAYNTARYIQANLESVFAQTFRDYEVIVVNDGSPDTGDLERVLAPYRDRIVYIRQKNRGPAGARNTGIRASRGAFIALLDSDDLWEPEYLAVHVGILIADPTIDVLYPNAVIIGDSPLAGREFMDLSPSEGEVTFERLVTEECTVVVSATARREAILGAGMFDETLNVCEDFDLWLRILKRGGRIAYHRKVLLRYRRRSGSLSADSARMCIGVQRVLEKLRRTTTLTPSEEEAVARGLTTARVHQRLNEARRAFLSGETQKAIEAFGEANYVLRSLKIRVALVLLRFTPRVLLRVYRVLYGLPGSVSP